MAELAPGWTPYRYGFNNPVKFIDPDGMFEYVTGGYGEQIEMSQVWSHTEDVGYRSDIEGSSGTGKSNAKIVVERANNIYNELKEEGARRAKIKAECCQDDKKKRDSKHPSEIARSENGGYGYMGVSKNVGSVTWYQMSDKRGKPFWVDKDWNSKNKSFNFWDTHMGHDLQEGFPLLKDENKRKQIGVAAISIFETFFLEKAIRWPILIPIYIPEEFYREFGNNSQNNLQL
ncbi:hypothetical protein [Mongoliibacter ruber]|nr:hypothetical protein [Mongoliibacter ruber]